MAIKNYFSMKKPDAPAVNIVNIVECYDSAII